MSTAEKANRRVEQAVTLAAQRTADAAEPIHKRGRRHYVLLNPNDQIASSLRAKPGVWLLVAVGGPETRRTLITTAGRINSGVLKDFRPTKEGRYEARTTSAKDRPDAVAAVEMMARYVPYQ